MLRLSVTIVQRIVRVWRWRRCVFMVITSRTGNGRIRRGMGWRGWGTHEQFLILDTGVGTRSVGPCGICMLVGSAIEWIRMRKVVALIEAWVSAQQAWLVHMGLVGNPLWYPGWWGTWCVVVLALCWVGIMMVSHDGWMNSQVVFVVVRRSLAIRMLLALSNTGSDGGFRIAIQIDREWSTTVFPERRNRRIGSFRGKSCEDGDGDDLVLLGPQTLSKASVAKGRIERMEGWALVVRFTSRGRRRSKFPC